MYLRPIRMALVLDNKLFRGETQVNFALQASGAYVSASYRIFRVILLAVC